MLKNLGNARNMLENLECSEILENAINSRKCWKMLEILENARNPR